MILKGISGLGDNSQSLQRPLLTPTIASYAVIRHLTLSDCRCQLFSSQQGIWYHRAIIWSNSAQCLHHLAECTEPGFWSTGENFMLSTYCIGASFPLEWPSSFFAHLPRNFAWLSVLTHRTIDSEGYLQPQCSYFCASASRKRVVLLLGHAISQENALAFKNYRESVLGHACFSTPPTMRRWSIHAGQGWR